MSEKKYAGRVGLFVFAGLVLICALMLNFSRGVGFFKPRYHLNMSTRSVAGLKQGADVFLSGVKIGSVSEIKLNATSKGVMVELTILKEFQLHKDSRFVIEQQGVLGDQFVNITPGTPDTPFLQDGDNVEGSEPFNLNEVAQSANALIKQFDRLGATIEKAIGRVNDQVLDAQTLSNLSQTISNFKEVSEKTGDLIDHGTAIVTNGAPAISLALTNLLSFSRKLDKLAMDIDDTVNTNRLELNESMKNLRDATASLKQMTADMQSGKGLVGGVLKDEEMRLHTALAVSNLSVFSSNLNSRGIWSLLWKPKQPKQK